MGVWECGAGGFGEWDGVDIIMPESAPWPLGLSCARYISFTSFGWDESGADGNVKSA